MVPLAPGDHVRAEITELGSVSVRFGHATRSVVTAPMLTRTHGRSGLTRRSPDQGSGVRPGGRDRRDGRYIDVMRPPGSRRCSRASLIAVSCPTWSAVRASITWCRTFATWPGAASRTRCHPASVRWAFVAGRPRTGATLHTSRGPRGVGRRGTGGAESRWSAPRGPSSAASVRASRRASRGRSTRRPSPRSRGAAGRRRRRQQLEHRGQPHPGGELLAGQPRDLDRGSLVRATSSSSPAKVVRTTDPSKKLWRQLKSASVS